MTITDLKSYARLINANMSPTDSMHVILSRRATAYIMAFLNDRKKALSMALNNPNTAPAKRAKRLLELEFVEDTLKAISKQKQII